MTFYRSILCASVVALSASTAYGLPGEAAAVIRHCGKPTSESVGVNNATDQQQRDLTYNDLILHFAPEEGGWSFTSAWQGHLPATRGELEKSLPCFREAMREVAAAPAPAIDPTIASQSATPSEAAPWTFGIPHFWFIVGLVVLLIVVGFLLPRRRRRLAVSRVPVDRPYRRPSLRSRILRRRRPPPPPLA